MYNGSHDYYKLGSTVLYSIFQPVVLVFGFNFTILVKTVLYYHWWWKCILYLFATLAAYLLQFSIGATKWFVFNSSAHILHCQKTSIKGLRAIAIVSYVVQMWLIRKMIKLVHLLHIICEQCWTAIFYIFLWEFKNMIQNRTSCDWGSLIPIFNCTNIIVWRVTFHLV